MSDQIVLALKSGTELDGYTIESVLGTGGFGMTYKATETMLGRSVAIKEFLPAGLVTRAENQQDVIPVTPQSADEFEWGMQRFRLEAQTLVTFRHPNIVGVHRYFEANGTGYLVMEFVEGKTLGELLNPDKVLDEEEIREIVEPLLDGLKAIHEKGFLHRDIKPANIYIRVDGSPVLIDFGAARLALGQHSKSLTSIISSGYAPYEQYESTGQQGAWTDLYALGGVLYRSVTGVRPPDSPSRISALVREEPDPMPSAADAAKGSYSPALLGAIDAALATRESQRPQSVEAMLELLSKPAETAVAAATADQAVAPTVPDKSDETGPASAIDPATLVADSTSGSLRASGPDTSGPVATSGGAPEGKNQKWHVWVPAAAVVLLAGGLGLWFAFAPGEDEACIAGAKMVRTAIAAKDLPAAQNRIVAVRTLQCSKDTIAALDSEADALKKQLEAERQAEAEKARLKAKKEREKRAEIARLEAEKERKKKEEEARRKAEEERLKREEKARLEAELERKRKEEEARQKALEEQRKREEAAAKARKAACQKLVSEAKGSTDQALQTRIDGLVKKAKEMKCDPALIAKLTTDRDDAQGAEYLRNGSYPACITHFDRLIREADSARRRALRGECKIRSRDYAGAAADLDLAIIRDPAMHRYFYLRSTARYFQKQYEQALSDINRALNMHTDNADYYYRRGAIHARRGRYRTAMPDWDQAIRLGEAKNSRSRLIVYYRARGYAKLKIGQPDEGMKDFQKVLKISPNDAWTKRMVRLLRSTQPRR